MNPLILIKTDLVHKRSLYNNSNTAAGNLKTFISDGTSAIIFYRFMQYFNHINIFPLAWICQYLNKLINGCIIGLKADIGPGLIIAHPIGVIINSAVVAGDNLIIQSGVVIGENRGKSPRLGNNIFIGSGAKIFGDIEIKDNAAIGSNAVVLTNIEQNQKAFGVPSHKS